MLLVHQELLSPVSSKVPIWSLACKCYEQCLKKLVYRVFLFQFIVYDCSKTIHDYCDTHLDTNGIFRPPELIDLKILLELCEDKCDLPSVPEEIHHFQRRQRKMIREGREIPVMFIIVESSLPEFLWILLAGGLYDKLYFRVAWYVFRHVFSILHIWISDSASLRPWK